MNIIWSLAQIGITDTRAALTDTEVVMIGTGKMGKMVIHATNLSISEPIKEIEDLLRKN